MFRNSFHFIWKTSHKLLDEIIVCFATHRLDRDGEFFEAEQQLQPWRERRATVKEWSSYPIPCNDSEFQVSVTLTLQTNRSEWVEVTKYSRQSQSRTLVSSNDDDDYDDAAAASLFHCVVCLDITMEKSFDFPRLLMRCRRFILPLSLYFYPSRRLIFTNRTESFKSIPIPRLLTSERSSHN